jgi:hypothetical protein
MLPFSERVSYSSRGRKVGNGSGDPRGRAVDGRTLALLSAMMFPKYIQHCYYLALIVARRILRLRHFPFSKEIGVFKLLVS